jgi:O-succinylbenzoic acid--CoA ligase
MLTPDNILASACLVNEKLGLTAEDRWLNCLPRHHVGGLMIAYRCALAGAAMVLHEGFDPSAIADDLDRHRITHVSVVPPMLARLLEVTDGPPRWLRVLLVGGQALGENLAREAIEAGWPLYITYGMTETASQVATSGVLDHLPAWGIVGPVLSGIQIRSEGTLAAPRRLEVRGRVVMAGYVNPERQPGLGLEDGWFPTSDLGHIADNGDLVVLGRADQVLVIGGEAVLASLVEEKIAAAPGVGSVVVIGLEDPVWGHRLAAAYTGELSPERLDAWCRSRLTSRQRPRGFRRVERLPTLDSGKPDRARITGMLAGS